MKIKYQGHTLSVKNLDTARIRDVAELQQQTGWTLPEMRKAGAPGSAYTPPILLFLSLRAENIPTSWDEVLDAGYGDIEILTEPGDNRAQEAPESDPQEPSGASAPDDADHEAEAPTEG
ncbi:MAG: hypothetical protein IJO71_12565 [Microbacterium sp.]|uniref:hypothetical protein n=1 Tax=Microbacterium sp. TaxID=51671 RepID=UPI0025E316DD|nr:hypothetical protein [Microbacterium sp.]MBQ9918016.1 hypothetical protein [Microbacterium sp.]